MAVTILGRALAEPNVDDGQLVGVLYLLGNTYEALEQPKDAMAAYQRVYGVLGHTHQPDVQKLPSVGSAGEVFYLNSGTWIPGWDPDRPDLMGQVIYSVIRFRAQGDGDYRHEYLEWRPDRGALVPEMILARE